MIKALGVSLCALCLAGCLSGCTTAIRHGDIIEVDSTVFGFNIAASTGSTETPAVQFGLIRSKVLFVPTGTNKIYAPQFKTAGDLNNNGRTLVFGGSDSSTSGESGVVTSNTPQSLIQVKPFGITNAIIAIP